MYDNNLKQIRENLEMTQKELGVVFGVDESTYRGWEIAKDIIPLRHLIRFSNLYDVSIDYLLKLSPSNIQYEKYKINKENIGKMLKDIRMKLNLTQSKIAKECMISQTTYSNYEKGYYLVSTMTLYTICKKHKLSIDEVLGRRRK